MGSYEGENGADWWLWNKGVLPDYYIFINELLALGGDPARLLLSMLLTRCLPEAFIEMTMDICRMRQAEFGMRQI